MTSNLQALAALVFAVAMTAVGATMLLASSDMFPGLIATVSVEETA